MDTCNASHNLFGNNKTRNCEKQCVDRDSYADHIHPNRYCAEECTNNGDILYYRNNYTKTCVLSTDCPDNYFGDNSTKFCVSKCPIISNGTTQTWGHI